MWAGSMKSRAIVAIPEVRLWVGLTPEQLDALRTNNELEPGVGGRFGMRMYPKDAIDRAIFFEEGEVHPKKFTAVQVVLTPLGFTTFIQHDVLEKKGDNWWRWWGSLQKSVEALYFLDLDTGVAYM